MANPYRELLGIPGARVFVAAGFVGRMSMSMVGIGVVLLVSTVTGSYGIAGAVSATYALCYAGGSPIAGRLADRYGQQHVLVRLVSANCASFSALIICAQLKLPVWTLFPTAAAAGMTTPSLGAWVRARWTHVLHDRPGRLHTAFSFESVVDEAIFITGPIIVTVLATGLHPTAGVAACGAFTLGGGLALAAQRRTQPPIRPKEPGGSGSAITSPGVIVISLAFLMMGVAFAAIDVSLVAFAEEQGHKALSGVLIGILASGSGAAALWYGARTWRIPLHRRFLIGVGLFPLGMAALPLIPNLTLMMALIFFSGLAISPTIIPGYGVVERLVPRRQLTEGLTMVSTSVGVGLAIGASISGRIVDVHGARWAFLVPFCAGLAAAAVSLAGAGRLEEHELSS